MECWREQHARAERDPECGLEIHRFPHRPADHRDDDRAGELSSADGVARHDLERGERSLHEPPVLTVRAQSREEGWSCQRVWDVQAQDRHNEREHGCPSVSSDYSGERRRRRELRQGSQRECDTGDCQRPHGRLRAQERHCTHHRHDAQWLEMSTPGDLNHQQWCPQIKQERGVCTAASAPGDTYDDGPGQEVADEPDRLEGPHLRPQRGDRQEYHLRKRWVDRRDGWVVDESVPRRAQRLQRRRRRRVQVGIDASELHMAVPQVSIEIVRKRRFEGEEHGTEYESDCPDPEDRTGRFRGPGGVPQEKPGSEPVRCERGREQSQPQAGKSRRNVLPAEDGQEGDFGGACCEQPGLHRRARS